MIDPTDDAPQASNARKLQPLEREFRTGRIAGDLWLTSDRFEKTWRRANHAYLGVWGGSHYEPKTSDPAKPFGAEIAADAMFEDRFIASRLGVLYRVMVAACVDDARLVELVGESFPGQSTSEKDLASRGRERLVTALRLCEAAHAEFDDMREGHAPRLGYGLGAALPFATPAEIAAANDNARVRGNHVRLSSLKERVA